MTSNMARCTEPGDDGLVDNQGPVAPGRCSASLPMRDQQNGRNRIWRRVAIGCLVAFVVLDLFPSYGPPSFRYTGSDPAYAVWNLGWPLALAIYDPRSGVYIGPLFYFVVPFEAVVFSLAAAVFLFQRRHSLALQATTAPPCS